MEQSKLLTLGAGDNLGTVAFGRKATVPKSSPAPRVNSFDCSMNRHAITVYCYEKKAYTVMIHNYINITK
jgi:hypothetical protein